MKKRTGLLTILMLALVALFVSVGATIKTEASSITNNFNAVQSYVRRNGVTENGKKVLRRSFSSSSFDSVVAEIISVEDGEIKFSLDMDDDHASLAMTLYLLRDELEESWSGYVFATDSFGSSVFSMAAVADVNAPYYKVGGWLNYTIFSISDERYRSTMESSLEDLPGMFDSSVGVWDTMLESITGYKLADIGLGSKYNTRVGVKEIKLNTASAKMLTATSDKLPGQSGSLLSLKATITPSNATNKKINWSSSNKSVATVDSSGRVKGLKPGTVTITATSEDGGKKASCKVQVMSRKEVQLKAGAVYVFQSKLSNNYSMDVMYQNYATNTNVSLYTGNKSRGAQRFTIEKKVVNGKAWWMLTRKNSTVGKRAVTELKGKNLVFGVNKGTNWQLFRAYKFNDGTVQFINRGSNNAITVVGGKAVNRANIAPIKADLSNSQRWKCVVVG